MKTMLLAAVTALGLLATGCVVARPHSASSAAAVSSSPKKCPPGHQWSDGGCHATGKGNDPAKHAK